MNASNSETENVAPSDEHNMDADKTLSYLKEGNPKPLIGYSFGDPVDYNLVEKTGEYYEGGEIFRLKENTNKNIALFFDNESENFSGLVVSEKCNFFGIDLGTDSFNNVTDTLGKPDDEGISEMEGLYTAVYFFDNTSLRFYINENNTITQMMYKEK